ncbi:phage capsid completion protein [Betaproteobacteria bacterium]|nr:phage capsid completion protein [Betaproteobacteria bacterium]
MSFIAPAPTTPEADLPHHPFWPAISPADFRAVMNVDGTVTTPRLVFALTEAVVTINNDLKAWREAAQGSGATTLAEVDPGDPVRLPFLYRRAVFERAKADLMERMIGYSATADGQKRAEAQEPAIDDHYRNALWAVRDMLGECRTTVELI